MDKSADARLHELAEIDFTGKVGGQVTAYARKSRAFARDLAAELEAGAHDARQAMKGLKGHPGLMGIDVKLRARRVARKLKRAQELARGISAESVKFASEYRKQFIHEPAQKRTRSVDRNRKVDL